MRTNVTPNAVQAIYQEDLGRKGQSQYIMNWVNSGMSLDEIRTAVQNSKEGKEYGAKTSTNLGNNVTVDDSDMGGVIFDDSGMGASEVGGGKQAPITDGPVRGGEASPPPDSMYTPPPTMAEVNALYNQFLGRDGQPEYLQAWIDSGQDINQLANSIKNSVEGVEYAANQTVVDDQPDETNPDGSPNQGNQTVIDAIKAQQESYQAQQQALMAQLAAQQQAQQNMFSQYGQSAKGGTNQQGQQQPQKPMFAAGDGTGNMTGGTGIQPPNLYGQNPYSSGYGMGYQSPGMAGQYMPRSGLLGPSGFGGYGGYSPYGGGKGGGYAPAIMPQSPMMGKGGGYSTGIRPNNSGAMVPGAPDDAIIPNLPNTGGVPLTGGARPSGPPADENTSYGVSPVEQEGIPIPQIETPVTSTPMTPPPMYNPYGGKGGYRQPMYQQPMYQPMYRPMYQPRGGYYGGGYYG